jgi:predicted transposase YdaD
VRLWEQPVETLLTGGLGTLPLAPLGQLPQGTTPEESLPPVIGRLVERMTAELPQAEAARLLTAAFVLAGMRLSRETAIQMFQGVRAMKDSTTYQYIVDEGVAIGRVQEARDFLLLVGRDRFGEPDAATEVALQAITSLDRLHQLGRRLVTASGWQELLATP